MELKKVFKKLGYPKHSEKVYSTLIESKKPLLVSEMAKLCRLHRPTVYRSLSALLENGLVSDSDIGKRKFYTANSPRALQAQIKISEQQGEKSLTSIIKEHEKNVPKMFRFMTGPAGIRAAFDDVISHCEKGETFFRYTSEKDLQEVNRYLARDYRIRRDKKKLERLVISNTASGSQKKPRLERFIKFIPPEADTFEQNIIQLVYGKRVCLIDLNEQQVTIIENKQLADFQKVIFKLLYKRL